ncbi:hypothetical protein ACFY8B_00245 [Streptomyces sp. NPDC012751]
MTAEALARGYKVTAVVRDPARYRISKRRASRWCGVTSPPPGRSP